MDHSPKSYFLFNPEKGHFSNAMSLYVAVKRNLTKKYYGTMQEKNKEMPEDQQLKKQLKKTSFS
jgi:hypothetical protein